MHIGAIDQPHELQRGVDVRDAAAIDGGADLGCCGPPGLGNKLKPICKRLGMQFREEPAAP